MDVTNVDRVEVFQSEAGAWVWHGLAGNGEIVVEGESHTRPEDAARAVRGVFGDEMKIILVKP